MYICAVNSVTLNIFFIGREITTNIIKMLSAIITNPQLETGAER